MQPPIAHRACTREVAGVAVEGGPVPIAWEETGVPGCCADDDRFRYQTAGPLLYVEGGRRVVLNSPDAELRAAYDYLLYSVAARWLLLQRGRLVLHAVVVVSPKGEAVALAGRSTAGKTTALVGLLARGWTLAVDDTCEVSVDAATVTARPWRRPSHLAPHHVRDLGGSVAGLTPLPFADKYAFWLPQDLEPRPLAHVVILTTTATGPAVALPLRSSEAAAELSGATLTGVGRVGMIGRHRETHVRGMVAVSSRVPATRISRPTDGETAHAVADLIEQFGGAPARVVAP